MKPYPANQKPLALGIHWAHDASVSICSPDGILFSVQEERLNRIKHYYGFPCKAIELAFSYCGITAKDIDLVALSSESNLFPEHLNGYRIGVDGQSRSVTGEAPAVGIKERLKQVLGQGVSAKDQMQRHLEWAREKTAQMRQKVEGSWGEFASRHYCMQHEFLRDLGLFDERIPFFYIAHHRAHAASVYRLSGRAAAAVVTMDGKGDGLCATIFKGHADGRMELLRSSRAIDSLGSFYQAATEALGFIPVDGEYKTMGLAAIGNGGDNSSPFSSIVSVVDGQFRSSMPWSFRSFNDANPSKKVPNPLSSVAQTEVFKPHLAKMSSEQFAFFAQQHCEENMLAYAKDALQITGEKVLLGAGGVMLNVKANSRIRDELRPEGFFVFPDAADSGLAAGAAMEALHQIGALRGSGAAFDDPYKGPSFSKEEIEEEVRKFQQSHELVVKQVNASGLAAILAQGKVVGNFQGRAELGPRALGNRSVIADPRSAAVKDRINLILKGREWFVPFAPAVLKDEAHLYWDGPIDYKYMTFAVKANAFAKEKVPGVVHVDGTMRPQVVTAESNLKFHQLLTEFKKVAGVGVLINTSFNRHGLPIVGSPADALEHLVQGWVDGLCMDDLYVERQH